MLANVLNNRNVVIGVNKNSEKNSNSLQIIKFIITKNSLNV